MKCAHCQVAIHDNTQARGTIGMDKDGAWIFERIHCPNCRRFVIFLQNGDRFVQNSTTTMSTVKNIIRVWPQASAKPAAPAEVPSSIAEDYSEACKVLELSAKASAALSRRCLQNLLRDVANVRHADLSNEIQEVIDSNQLPTHLSESIDSIRNMGNFAAHPIKSKNTGEIMPVETHEAEWNLEVLEELFDHYYVKPAVVAAKRNAMNAKLTEAGKPPMK